MKALKCPVCMGNGQVPNGFYFTTNTDEEGNLIWISGSTEPETCRSCNGKGYIIVEENAEVVQPI